MSEDANVVGKSLGLSLWLELTPHCNWACVFCYNAWRPGDIQNYPLSLPVAQFRDGVKRLLFEQKFEYVALSGGEPLLYRGLDALVRAASETGTYTVLTTNGEHFSVRRADELRAAGLEGVQISVLSASQQVHNELTGRESWQAAMRAVLVALDSQFDVTVVITLTSANLPSLSATVELMFEMGVRRISLNLLQVAGSAKQLSVPGKEDAAPSPGDLEAIMERAQQLGINVQVIPDSGLLRKASWHRLTVTPEGNLKLCNMSSLHSAGTLDDGPVDRRRLLNAITSGDLREYATGLADCMCYAKQSGVSNEPNPAF